MQPRLDALQTALLEQALSASYVKRFVGEVAEHREDLIRDLLSDGSTPESAEAEADARMGEVWSIARASVAGLRSATFLGRHRVLSLVILPIVVFLLSCVALMLVAVAGTGMATHQRVLSAQDQSRLYLACGLTNYLLPGLVAIAFQWFAHRRIFGRYWPWVPCVTIGIFITFSTTRFVPAQGGYPNALDVGAMPTYSVVRLILVLAAAVIFALSYRSLEHFFSTHRPFSTLMRQAPLTKEIEP